MQRMAWVPPQACSAVQEGAVLSVKAQESFIARVSDQRAAAPPILRNAGRQWASPQVQRRKDKARTQMPQVKTDLQQSDTRQATESCTLKSLQ